MKFERESYSPEMVSEMLPLWKAHYDETADKFYGPLDPDLNFYSRAAAMRVLRIFTSRDGAGALHGYQVFVVGKHPHSKDHLEATQDILYLCPQSRRGLNAARFIQWCSDELKREGVKVVHQRLNAKHNFGRLLERLGYELEDLTYSKILGVV